MIVDVIRCKECMHRPIMDKGIVKAPVIYDGLSAYRSTVCPFICDDPYYNRMPDDNFFCANGEKMEIVL